VKRLIFFLIILVSALLRIYQIGSIPPSLTWDETAWGYNAYVLGIDGRDEFGKYLPLQYIESFGDFKPPLYAYLTIIPVKIFGLTEFATRLPSAVFGVLTVILTYFLVKEVFGEKKEELALFSMFMLSISPWHILLSRGAFEANIASFFIVSGVYFFLISIRKNMWFISLSIISFVLSMYTFNTARVVSPLLFIVLCLFFLKKIIRKKIAVTASGIAGFIIFLPLFLFLLSPISQIRFHEVNIFTDSSLISRVNQQVENDNGAFWSKIIHNRRFAFGVEYVRHYFDNLSPQFLFVRGDGNPKFSIQDVGQLYIWEVPFFILGAFYLFRKREKYWYVLPIWLVLGIAPAAVARETPHALRIESSLPTFQILTAYGLYQLAAGISNIKYKIANIHIKYLIFSLYILFLIFNFSYFLHNYLNHYSREFSSEWQYGYKEAVEFAEENKYNYDSIYVTTELGRPYIYFLFYSKYAPEKFRSEAKIRREVLGFVHVDGFDKYHFLDDFSEIDLDGNNLYVNTPSEVPESANIIKEFRLLNGEVGLMAYTL